MRQAAHITWGIDEAGRGPLAGPVSVAVFGMRQGFRLAGFPSGRDSKKMSEREREKWYEVLEMERAKGNVFFAHAFSSASVIDRKGIVHAINAAMAKCFALLHARVDGRHRILLDGSLHAPERFVNQKTIIKGDEKEKVIACASIIAKVKRDRSMAVFSKKYPAYGFDAHKGYGTAAHRRAIAAHGLSPLHRASFCRRCA
jgi:ribonuclease HII